YTSIRDELEQYDDALSTREEIIVVSKCEYENASQVQETLATHAGQPVHSISAQTGANLDSFISIVLDRLDARREEAIEVSAPLSDQGETETPDLPKTKKRLPPHKAGPTKDMSNDRQAKDIVP
ncbi:MAG: GTPase ObgE, partial [Planctomycetota bacterium]